MLPILMQLGGGVCQGRRRGSWPIEVDLPCLHHEEGIQVSSEKKLLEERNLGQALIQIIWLSKPSDCITA